MWCFKYTVFQLTVSFLINPQRKAVFLFSTPTPCFLTFKSFPLFLCIHSREGRGPSALLHGFRLLLASSSPITPGCDWSSPWRPLLSCWSWLSLTWWEASFKCCECCLTAGSWKCCWSVRSLCHAFSDKSCSSTVDISDDLVWIDCTNTGLNFNIFMLFFVHCRLCQVEINQCCRQNSRKTVATGLQSNLLNSNNNFNHLLQLKFTSVCFYKWSFWGTL